MPKIVWTTGFVLALLGGAASAARGATIDRDYLKQFPAPPGTRLVLEHGDGDVTVTAWDKAEVDIHIVYRGEVKQIGFGTAPDFRAEFRQNGNTISVIGKESSGTSFGMRFVKIEEYTYTVRAPSGVVLDLRGGDGDVDVTGWRGDIACRLEDGNAHLSQVEASIQVHTEDGDVTLDGCRGKLTAESEDGDVQVEGSTLSDSSFKLEDGNLTLRDCSGDLEAQLEDGNVVMDGVHLERAKLRGEDGNFKLDLKDPGAIDLDVTCSDGDVKVSIEAGAQADLALHSDEGTIDLDLGGVSDLKRERGGVTGRLGDGTGRIRIRTADGDIVLHDRPSGSDR